MQLIKVNSNLDTRNNQIKISLDNKNVHSTNKLFEFQYTEWPHGFEFRVSINSNNKYRLKEHLRRCMTINY